MLNTSFGIILNKIIKNKIKIMDAEEIICADKNWDKSKRPITEKS